MHTLLGFFIKRSSCTHEPSPIYCNILHRPRRYILRSKLARYPGNVSIGQERMGKPTKTQCRQRTIHTSEIQTGKSRTHMRTSTMGPQLAVTSANIARSATTVTNWLHKHSLRTNDSLFTVSKSPCYLFFSHLELYVTGGELTFLRCDVVYFGISQTLKRNLLPRTAGFGSDPEDAVKRFF